MIYLKPQLNATKIKVTGIYVTVIKLKILLRMLLKVNEIKMCNVVIKFPTLLIWLLKFST